MRRLVALCSVLACIGVAAPARAGEAWPCYDTAYWCTRDAIYDQFKLIAHLEANPDIDDGVKGPAITAARAEIHRLRATIHEPPPHEWTTIAAPLHRSQMPCCYARQPIHIR